MEMTTQTRLEYLRGELRAERISYGEIAELQIHAENGDIDPGDVELLEAAGVPEFAEAPRIEVEATAHTPTPWRQLGETSRITADANPQGQQMVVADMSGDGPRHCADAALIVQAVNSHVQLVDALRTVADLYHADRCPVYHFSGGKGACNCHVGIARAALQVVAGQG